MSTQFTVNNNAAFIKYNGAWDKGDGSQRVATASPGTRRRQSPSSATLKFTGPQMFLNGGLQSSGSARRNGGGGKILISFDGCDPIPVTSDGVGEGQLYENASLEPGVEHTAEITLVEGTFSFGKFIWGTNDVYSPPRTVEVNANLKPEYTTYPADNWTPRDITLGTPIMCTNKTGSGIIMKFKGNAIVIRGAGSTIGDGSSFDVNVDDKPAEKDLYAYSPSNINLDLYRKDDLPDGDHTVTLINTSKVPLCVGQAQFFDVTRANPPAKMARRSPLIQSDGLRSLFSGEVVQKTMNGEGITGIAIVALLIPALLVATGLFFRQRRRRANRSNKRDRSEDCPAVAYVDEK